MSVAVDNQTEPTTKPANESDQPDLRGYYEESGRRFRFVPDLDPVEEVRVRLMLRLMPRKVGRSVLDVGCGDGYLCKRLSDRRFETVVGVDFAATRIAYARGQSAGGQFAQSDVYALPFAGGQFDVVTCGQVLEHLTDPELALHELARVSRRYVICTTPYREPRIENVCPRCDRSFPLVGHLQSFDEYRFERMAETAGMRLRKWRHTHPLFEYRRFRYCPPLRWLIADYYKDSGFIGCLFEKFQRAGR